jgi:hypothetical protein
MLKIIEQSHGCSVLHRICLFFLLAGDIFVMLTSPVAANEISFAPLNAVLFKADHVIQGTLEAWSSPVEKHSSEAYYTVRVNKILKGGALPQTVKLRFTYYLPSMEKRMPDGRILYVSPVVDYSGEELSVKKGNEYLFLFKHLKEESDDKTVYEVLRIEPLRKENQS